MDEFRDESLPLAFYGRRKRRFGLEMLGIWDELRILEKDCAAIAIKRVVDREFPS
jgi:hypothetical protein